MVRDGVKFRATINAARIISSVISRTAAVSPALKPGITLGK